jgi:transcriptional regulator of acetoin/glycerol metabolism
VSDAVMAMFKRYPWPGNIRQLHNLLRTAVVMVGCEGEIREEHLPDDFLEELSHPPASAATSPFMPAVPLPARFALPLLGGIELPTGPLPDEASAVPVAAAAPADPRQRLQDVALAAMTQMLRLHNGNVSAAAKALGVSRNTIYRKKDLLPPDLLR